MISLILCLLVIMHALTLAARLGWAGSTGRRGTDRWWVPNRPRAVNAILTDILGLVVTQPQATGGVGHAMWLSALVVTASASALTGWAWPHLPKPVGIPWAAITELVFCVVLLVPLALMVH